MNNLYDNILSNIFFNDNYHLNRSIYFKFIHGIRKQKYNNILTYLNNRYDNSESLKETLYRIKNKIEIRPICKECRNKVNFIGKGEKLFATFCSNTCSGKNIETIKKKQISDRLKNNGELGWVLSNKSEKKKQHRIETFYKKYGSVKEGLNLEKVKNTCYNRYGVNSPMNVDEFKQKRYKSLKKNFTYGTSKQEQKLYEMFLSKFDENDIITQYSSNEYPFSCDFYIKSLNMYIEYNGSHFHMGKPYNKSKENEIILNELHHKSELIKLKHNKTKTQYDVMIYVWTDLDVRKRETARINNLNFVELWNLKEAEEFINNL